MLDVNLGIKSVPSGYALFRLAPRHNVGADSLFRTQDYLDHFGDLVQNRLLMAGIALALILLTILIYEAAKLRFHSGVGAWNHSRRPVLRFHGYAGLSSYRKHSHRIYAAAAVLCA